MQTALNKAHFWAQTQGLTFSVAKSTAMIFSDYESQFSTPLRLGEDEIEVKDETVYLGVTIHHSLSWDMYISKKVIAAKKHLMLLRQAVGAATGAPHLISCGGCAPVWFVLP
jgi:hypothetical protein